MVARKHELQKQVDEIESLALSYRRIVADRGVILEGDAKAIIRLEVEALEDKRSRQQLTEAIAAQQSYYDEAIEDYDRRIEAERRKAIESQRKGNA